MLLGSLEDGLNQLIEPEGLLADLPREFLLAHEFAIEDGVSQTLDEVL